jgi:cell division protein FtsA
MPRREDRELLVGLDIGTSKCVAVIGQVMPEGEVEVVGEATAPNRGVNRGDVVNIDATVQAIRRAVENAEQMAGCRAQSVHVGMSGTHLQSRNSTGVAPVRGREVTQKDVESVIDAARAVLIPADQRILHVIPQEYMVDGRDGIHEPVGMFGVRLEARVHMICGSESAQLNIRKCVENCELTLDQLIVPHLAASEAVLLPEEKSLGVCMVDLGAGTADLAVFKGGAVRHTAVLALGGNLVTNDISVAFRTPHLFAEEIKIAYGCALPEMVPAGEVIEVRGVGDGPVRQLSRHTLAEVIRPRYEEIFRFLRKELHRSETYDMVAGGGVVLTGGASAMPGIQELAESVFEVPVRIGLPQNIRGLNERARDPAYATAVGLLMYGHREMPRRELGGERHAGYWVRRVKDWVAGNF